MLSKINSPGYIRAFIIIGILLPLSIIFFDSPDRDECYQALNVVDYRNSPLAPLTFFNGYVWLKIFGDTALNLRILCFLCNAFAIGAGCMVFRRITSDGGMAALLFMMLNTASQVWGMHIYNWDTGAYPFTMLSMLSAIYFWRKPSLKSVALLSLCTALLGAARIPAFSAAALMPVMIAVRLRKHPLRCVAGYVGGYMAGVAAVVVLLIFVIYGGFNGLAEAWSPSNVITGHGLSAIDIYIKRITLITPQLCTENILPLLFMFGAYVLTSLRHTGWTLWGLSVLLILATTCFLIYIIPVHTFYCLMFIPFVVAWCIPVFRKLHSSGVFVKPDYIAWITLVFVCVPIIGSDGFQERFMVLPALPVVLARVYPELRRYIFNFVVLSFIGAASMLAIKECYYISQGVNALGDVVPRLKGIFIADDVALAYTQQGRLLSALKADGKRVAFVGNNRMEGNFLLGAGSVSDIQAYRCDGLQGDREEVEERLNRFDALLIFYPVYTGNFLWEFNDVDSLNDDIMEQFIIAQGFEKSPERFVNFALYVRGGNLSRYSGYGLGQ